MNADEFSKIEFKAYEDGCKFFFNLDSMNDIRDNI